MSHKTADLCDQYHEDLGVCNLQLKSYGGKKVFSGPIATVKIYDNYNDIFMEAIKMVEPGTVIVLDGVESRPCAFMGDRKAGIAASRGVAGIIINGFVRDVEGLAKLDIGVLALGSHPLSSKNVTQRKNRGVRDVVLDFGDIDWTPGHYVYADEDGVVVSSQKL